MPLVLHRCWKDYRTISRIRFIRNYKESVSMAFIKSRKVRILSRILENIDPLNEKAKFILEDIKDNKNE